MTLDAQRPDHAPSDHPALRHGRTGILLANLGTPDGTDYWSMRRYLSEFLSDQRVIDYIKGVDVEVSSSNAAALALYFRYLKRINSHLRNVATSVVNPFDQIGYMQKTKNK